MLTLQEIADIASRYDTEMSRAMLVACLVKAQETDEPCVVSMRTIRAVEVGIELAEERRLRMWRRYVELNSDTRDMHV